MNSRPQAFATQSDLPTLFNEADKCRAQFDFAGAIQLLERARKLHPTVDKAWVKLGVAHAHNYDFAAAERCFEEGIRVSPTKAGVLNAVGHHWIEVRHYDAARRSFERVIDLGEAPLAVLVKLAETYIRLRRLDDATQLAERAQTLYPDQDATLILRAKVQRQTKQLEDAEKLLRRVVAKTDSDPQGRAAAWYELGAVLDQQARYDDAMAAFVQAKTLVSVMAARPLKLWQMKESSIQAMRTAITGNQLQQWRERGKTDLQPARKLALLCGEARSGTTLLEYILDAHPDIISADETSVFQNKTYLAITSQLSAKTPFLSAVDALTPRTLRQLRAEYFCGTESFLQQSIGDRLLLDKNPALTFEIPSMVRIFPECKFLVALRDPRDVCLSCFMQPAPLLPDTALWLTLGGTAEHYATIMNVWLTVKPHLTETAMEVRYEDVVENLEPTVRNLLQFLQLPWNDNVLNSEKHTEKKIVRSPTFAEVSRPVYKTAVRRWENYQKYMEPCLDRLTPFVAAFGYK